MLYAVTSTEGWEDPFRAGYWEKMASLELPKCKPSTVMDGDAKNILFMPTEEAMWFCDEHKKY